MTAGRAVIFDLDGVLLDSERVAMGRWRQAGELLGLDGIEQVYLRCIGTTPAKTRKIFTRCCASASGGENWDICR